MEPEIARRCTACGASVRGAAHFCPQCGSTLANAAAQGAATEQPVLVEEAERVASSLEGRLSAPRGVEEKRAESEARGESSRGENCASAANNASVTKTERASFDQSERAPFDRTTRGANQPAASTTQPTTSTPQPAASAAQPATSSVRQADAQSPTHAPATAERSGVGESRHPRVERLRERSVVVLDEAADDPGLRFVLVAGALFVVALLLFVLSFVLR
jgi:hypothetical protein